MKSKENLALGRTAAVALLLFAPQAAMAHQIWIEQDRTGARLYFGEFGDNVREISPGYLDKFPGPAGYHVTGKGAEMVTLSKTASAFVIPARAGAGESLVVEETAYPVMERKEGPKTTRTLWTPAARWIADFRAQPARLQLDIVPTGKTGEVQVVFRGQPLPRAEIGIVAASGWGQEKHTDEQGRATFGTPWKSAYVIKVRHVVNTPGKRAAGAGQPEAAYDAASFATTLAFATSKGLAPPPPPARSSSPPPPPAAKAAAAPPAGAPATAAGAPSAAGLAAAAPPASAKP